MQDKTIDLAIVLKIDSEFTWANNQQTCTQ